MPSFASPPIVPSASTEPVRPGLRSPGWIHADRGPGERADRHPAGDRHGDGAHRQRTFRRRSTVPLAGRRARRPGSGASARPLRRAARRAQRRQPDPHRHPQRNHLHDQIGDDVSGHDRRLELHLELRRLLQGRLDRQLDRELQPAVDIDHQRLGAQPPGHRGPPDDGDRPDGCPALRGDGGGHRTESDRSQQQQPERGHRQQRMHAVRGADARQLLGRGQRSRIRRPQRQQRADRNRHRHQHRRHHDVGRPVPLRAARFDRRHASGPRPPAPAARPTACRGSGTAAPTP